MLKMSFYNGTLNKELAKQCILNSNKHCEYTDGLAYRNPFTHNKLITKEYAIELINTRQFVDITEDENRFHINTYNANDMW